MLNDDSYFFVLKGTIKKIGFLELPAYGNSMFPFIRQGNICRFVGSDPFAVKRGDVILYYSQEGRLIAHRLIEVKRVDQQCFYLLKGDTNLGVDDPIDAGRMIGKLASVQKSHVNFSTEQWIPRIWGKVILTFPFISGILRQFLNWKFKLQF